MATGTPRLDRQAIQPLVAGTGPGGQSPDDPKKVQAVAAFRLGWALQELVVRYRLDEVNSASPHVIPGPFPPDMARLRPPVGQLENTLRQLDRLRPSALALDPHTTGIGDEEGRSFAILRQQVRDIALAWSPDAATIGVETSPCVTDADQTVGHWDQAVLEKILEQDGDAAETIATAYEVGKALSLTYWRIWHTRYADPTATPDDVAARVYAVWRRSFGHERVAHLQRHLQLLSEAWDPRVTTIIGSSLGYWRAALREPGTILAIRVGLLDRFRGQTFDGTPTTNPTVKSGTDNVGTESMPAPGTGTFDGTDTSDTVEGSWSGPDQTPTAATDSVNESFDSAPSSPTSRVTRTVTAWMVHEHPGNSYRLDLNRLDKLLEALDEQRANWFDLMTGRRTIESFPVAAVIALVTKDVKDNVLSMARRFLPFVLGMLLTVGAVMVMVAALVFVVSKIPGSSAAGASLTSLGAVLTGILGFVATRGSVLFSRGAALLSGGAVELGRLQTRITSLEANATQAAVPGSSGGAPNASSATTPIPTTQGITQSVLANVVAQTQLEEYCLAASEPLVRFVLGPVRGETDQDDPRLRLDRFLKVINADANLDRLQMVLRSMLTAAGTE